MSRSSERGDKTCRSKPAPARYGQIQRLVEAAIWHARGYPDVDVRELCNELDVVEELATDSLESEARIAILESQLAEERRRHDETRALLGSEGARAERRIRKYLSQVVETMRVDSLDPHGFWVYILWGDDSDRPLYVGRSANILRRLGTHMGGDKRTLTRRVQLLRCESREYMEGNELALIAELKPSINVAGVYGREATLVARP